MYCIVGCIHCLYNVVFYVRVFYSNVDFITVVIVQAIFFVVLSSFAFCCFCERVCFDSGSRFRLECSLFCPLQFRRFQQICFYDFSRHEMLRELRGN